MVQVYCITRLWPKQDRPPHVLTRASMMDDEGSAIELHEW
jgi:hypothetical protein